VRPEFSEANLPCCAFSWLQFEFQTAGAQYYEPGITADTLGCWQCLRNLTRFVPQNILPQVAAPGIRKMFPHLIFWDGNTSKSIGIVSSHDEECRRRIGENYVMAVL
jgi:hypothetical protein